MGLLNPEQSKYYDDFNNMFATPGWRQLMEECKEEIFNRQASALEAKTWEHVVEHRGAAITLNYFLSLESIIDNQKSDFEDDGTDDADV